MTEMGSYKKKVKEKGTCRKESEHSQNIRYAAGRSDRAERYRQGTGVSSQGRI